MVFSVGDKLSKTAGEMREFSVEKKNNLGKLYNEEGFFVKMQVVLMALFIRNYLKFILQCLTQNTLLMFTSMLCKC